MEGRDPILNTTQESIGTADPDFHAKGPRSMTVFPPLSRSIAMILFASSLVACGGLGDDDEPVPEGAALSDAYFIGSDSYNPLDKILASGAYISASDANYGTRNPAYRNGSTTQSAWGIDTSASAESKYTITYSMDVSKGSNTDSTSLTWLRNNLKINASTGLITQQCAGYPDCYDNPTTESQTYEITAIATINGSSKSLKRKFKFVIRPHN